MVLVATPLRDLQNEPSETGLVTSLLVTLASTAIIALIPVSVAVAVLRYRLVDVDVWLSRGLVHGTLILFVVGVYVAVVGGFGLVWRDGGTLLPVVATGLAAVVFNPVRLRVQERIHRWVYGARDDPRAVVAELGQRLASAVPSDQVAQTIVDTLGAALRLPHVLLELADGDAHRRARHPARHRPALVPGGVPGSARSDGWEWHRALGNGSPSGISSCSVRWRTQAGPAVRAAGLTADLRRSRHRAVSIREEERRRLHRDLHDGLGPTLASLCQRLGATQHLVVADPARAIAVLSELEGQIAERHRRPPDARVRAAAACAGRARRGGRVAGGLSSAG